MRRPKVGLPFASRLFFLGLFLFLFITTDYRGKDEISVALNAFFRMDPLVAASYLLSEKGFIMLLLPGLIVLAATFLLGRFFCGWMCPMGTVIDLASSRIRKTRPLPFLKGRLRYYLLFTLLFSALFGMSLTGLLDPMAILVRFLTFSVYPLAGFLAKQGWVGLYRVLGDTRDYLDPGYDFLKNYVLPFRDTFYPLALVSLLFLSAIIALERFGRRSWCRSLCPAGALLSLAARFCLVRRLPARLCADCGDCAACCPTAFDEGGARKKEDCILCLECESKCEKDRVSFRLSAGPTAKPPFLPERRVLIAGALSGLFVSRMLGKTTTPEFSALLRPPGVRDEPDFLKKCVRCGECMKVCLRSALYPASLQAGLYGLYTPTLVPRLGYCEYNCTLCGQVCPTGAIPRLSPGEKKKAVIGLAVFDKNHCIPHAKRMNCMVCEEHCPVPQKAIRFETATETGYDGKPVTLKKPYVVDDLCIGCGICEYVCPLEERAGIRVYKKIARSK